MHKYRDQTWKLKKDFLDLLNLDLMENLWTSDILPVVDSSLWDLSGEKLLQNERTNELDKILSIYLDHCCLKTTENYIIILIYLLQLENNEFPNKSSQFARVIVILNRISDFVLGS